MAREKGMGNLQLEKSGRWTMRVGIGGKRYCRSTRTKDRDQAERVLQRFLAPFGLGINRLPLADVWLERWDGGDGGFEGGQVFVIVVPRHGSRFVADDRLDDMKRNARVGRKGDEGVPERVKGRLGRLAVASLKPDRGLDVRSLEDARKLVAHTPTGTRVHLGNSGEDGACENCSIVRIVRLFD